MGNNYLICRLESGRFISDTSIQFKDLKLENKRVINGDMLIDTGCSFTNIPLISLGINNSICLDMKKEKVAAFISKREEIKGMVLSKEEERLKIKNIGLMVTGGVESAGRKRIDIVNAGSDELLHDNSVSFLYRTDSVKFAGYDLGSQIVKVNYNRLNVPLLGMNILSMLDYHSGKSFINGRPVFIGCLRDQENKADYYQALYDHFGYIHEN